jgi:hypothetical protein
VQEREIVTIEPAATSCKKLQEWQSFTKGELFMVHLLRVVMAFISVVDPKL